jgi:predicted O-linked N-acetylglucosamine transferase (SPINDLY family)
MDIAQLMNHAAERIRAGDWQGCEAACRRVLERSPHHSEALNLLGIVCCRSGHLTQGVALFRRAIQARGNVAGYHHNLGKALRALGQPPEAASAFERALALNPNHVEAHFDLAALSQAEGDLPKAVHHYRVAGHLRPDLASAFNNLGNALRALDRADEAIAAYRQAVTVKPDFAEACSNLALALQAHGSVDEAIAMHRRAVTLKPENAVVHNNFAEALLQRKDNAEAAQHAKLAATLNPEFAEAHNNLGVALMGLGRSAEALDGYREALRLNPRLAEAHNNLGKALFHRGNIEEAIACFRKALEIKPGFVEAHSTLLLTLTYAGTTSPEELFAEHRRFEAMHAAAHTVQARQHPNRSDPQKRLRIGYVSPDLRNHAVAYFIEPVLAHHDHQAFEVCCYYNYPVADEVTARIRQNADRWVDCASLTDEALADRIRGDGIDVLVDLTGHTARNRLLVFARMPAPVQASFLGYPGTTGLEAIGYRFVSRIAVPPGTLDAQFSEKLVYVPYTAPFQPPAEAPEVNPLPAMERGFVTFASFNHPGKIGDRVIALWGRILEAVPNSRMLIGAAGDEGLRTRLTDAFALHGISSDRLDFRPRAPLAAYLAMHHEVDMVLDSFPYNGGTTSNHALWMGVPVLVLAGDRLAQRQGAAVVGGTEWVVEDEEAYLRQAISAAGDLPALAALRAGMRERILNDRLRQPETVTRGLESAYRMMWQRWCAGLSPESFEVTL